MNLKLVAWITSLSIASAALAADAWKLPMDTAKIKPGAGAPLTTANCALCHSADYISTQPPLTRAQWQGTVVKMQQKYGAPIATNNVNAIADYLFQNYGLTNK